MGDPISDHIWVQSPAADRVWAQISPITQFGRPWERRFVVLQAFIDDSASDVGTFVLAGYIASAERWAEFAGEWEALLPLATMGSNNKRRFKMSEMAARMRDVPPFYRLIEKYAALGVSCKIDVRELARAIDRIWIDGRHINFNHMVNPYFVAFWMLLQVFHTERQKDPRLFSVLGSDDKSVPLSNILPLDQKVDFYFDEHSSKKSILDVWDFFLTDAPGELLALYGPQPRFENDEDFMPLQAADFWAWWTRKGYEDGNLRNYQEGKFPGWTGTKPVPIPGVAIAFDEDDLVTTLMEALRFNMAHQFGDEAKSIAIYDAKHHPRPVEPVVPDAKVSGQLSLTSRLFGWLWRNRR